MATPVELPQFGTTVEECVITRWVKQKGDVVAAGDLVAEIETDKTTFEVTAPVDGTLLDTFFDEGSVVPVFTRICVIGNAGENIDEFRPGRSLDRPPGQTLWTPKPRRFATRTRGATTGPRAVLARRMRESLANTAQYTLHSSASAAGLVAVRAKVKASADMSAVNINDLVAYCTVHALRDAPSMNAEYTGGEIRTHTEVHLGFACDTPRGLMVPVVRNAHRLSLGDLAARMKALAAQAVEGTISPDDLSGGTFTISNLGSLGVEMFTPVINPPQVAVLGVGAIQPRPVRNGATVEFVDTIALSLTCDHQVIDGAPGARFLRTVREKIESVESLLTDGLHSAF